MASRHRQRHRLPPGGQAEDVGHGRTPPASPRGARVPSSRALPSSAARTSASAVGPLVRACRRAATVRARPRARAQQPRGREQVEHALAGREQARRRGRAAGRVPSGLGVASTGTPLSISVTRSGRTSPERRRAPAVHTATTRCAGSIARRRSDRRSGVVSQDWMSAAVGVDDDGAAAGTPGGRQQGRPEDGHRRGQREWMWTTSQPPGPPPHRDGVQERAAQVAERGRPPSGRPGVGDVQEVEVVLLGQPAAEQRLEEGRDAAPVGGPLADEQHPAHAATRTPVTPHHTAATFSLMQAIDSHPPRCRRTIVGPRRSRTLYGADPDEF